MRNLLSANLNRLLKNRAFWMAVMLMACIEGIYYFLMLRNGSIPMDVILFFPLQFIGVLAAVFLSLFLGTEYSDGTIRNKFIVGHKRSSVYLASLITGIIAITIIYLAGIITGSVLGILLYVEPYYGVGQIVLAGVAGWFSCIYFISIFNLIGMLSSSKSLTAIICMLTAFTMMFFGLYAFNLLSKPDYLIGTERAICQTLLEINPSGQILQIMSIDIASPWRLNAYSLLLSFSLTGLGLYVFRKKDLK